jgi:hypothetical protein
LARGVVRVRIEQRDRLPRPQRQLAAEHRHAEARRREQRQHMIRAVAGGSVAVSPPVVAGQELRQRIQQVGL